MATKHGEDQAGQIHWALVGVGAGQEVSVSLAWKLERPVVTGMANMVLIPPKPSAQFGS